MVKALFDTNILIDYLNGVAEAKVELARYREKAISLITWMEVMIGTTAETASVTRSFLASFELCPITEDIAEQAVHIRKTRRIKLPDAIVGATALAQGCLFVTRNVKDFPAEEPGVRVPYKI
jgi:predicted nucleic acid-binding protein